jgi:hypothetical protein
MNKIYGLDNTSERNFGVYNLKDDPVLDSLTAISRISDGHQTCVVGGMATNLYCWPEIPRSGTNDIDLNTVTYLTKNKFHKGIGRDLSKELEELGYSPRLWASGRNFGMNVTDDDEKGVLFITLPNRSRKHYKSHLPIMDREYENSMEIEIPNREGEKIRVIRPEDIIAPKLRRLGLKDVLDISYLLKAIKKSGIGFDSGYLEESSRDWHFGIEDFVRHDLEKFEHIKNDVMPT